MLYWAQKIVAIPPGLFLFSSGNCLNEAIPKIIFGLPSRNRSGKLMFFNASPPPKVASHGKK